MDLNRRANESKTLAQDIATGVELIQQSMDQGLLPKLETLTENLETANIPDAIEQSRMIEVKMYSCLKPVLLMRKH